MERRGKERKEERRKRNEERGKKKEGHGRIMKFDGTNICLPTVHLYINCLWCSFLSCATVNCDDELC